jgi:tetratricopeptide (TPR) repeat protein
MSLPAFSVWITAVGCLSSFTAWAQVSAPRDAAVLSMAASSSGRPKECTGGGRRGEGAWHPTIWDAARQPSLARYCDLLGRAQARLAQAPAASREAASVADQILPGHAAPWVIRGRANVALRNFSQALDDFRHARAVDPRSVEEPMALRDLALAQRMSAKQADAMLTYRALVPRLALLPSGQERVAVLIEASSLAMTLGDDGLREAAALLSEARNQPPSKLDAEVLALLALVLDRQGAPEQAAAVTDGLARRGLRLPTRTAEPQAFGYLADPSDALAMLATAIERTDPKAAAELWDSYVAESKGSRWNEHGRRHLDACKAMANKPRPIAPVQGTQNR